MRTFEGKLAVITGCGSGIGRALMRQLASEGANVAGCDVIEEHLEETLACVRSEAPNVHASGHYCDVGIEEEVTAFRHSVQDAHKTDRVHLLFNNAGIGGGGSFVSGPRDHWERTFQICWGGVYWCTREFLPLLVASEKAHIVNISSVNGFWASLGPMTPHTAYSAAKFAVKGFSEALITDLRLNAPHVKVSVVMPGHIGTSIATNSQRILTGSEEPHWTDEELEAIRERWLNAGFEIQEWKKEQLKEYLLKQRDAFRDNAPTSSSDAARVILEGVREKRWRILVGDDAHRLDVRVRANPERAYEPDFFAPHWEPSALDNVF